MKYLPYILIALVIFLAAGFYLDRANRYTEPVPLTIDSSSNNINKLMPTELKNYGPAPEFKGITKWLNSDPLTLEDLKGKVVLVDFWTYSCINCIRTLPYVTKWYDTYKDQGLVIVGVHTPEFAFEKVTENVQTAIKRFNINYPVAQDNDFQTWNAYSNRYWPAHYLIDKEGNVVYTHFGEGNYGITENNIRYLLGLNSPANTKNPTFGKVGSPEMYFGLSRLENLSSKQTASSHPNIYNFPDHLKLNEFALNGEWKFENEKTVLTKGSGIIRLKFKAGKLHMVASSDKPQDLKITVDGKIKAAVKVQMSELYTLFDSNDYSEHTIDIEIPEAGFEAFTFTFG